ncbi:uncharacterized protein Triagg1_9376 [Trichoderma aggressivum f. europaeum]|uniref:Uncharacterized protein n=1 Tax=Trichoderma aggressivum f. europaeum TaxID=173218 RepID=A0AAE1LX48_9HYPO|nr:hypothetical protein Triagg1_9376 [Trichoderma aggressivum f. europaeum]
MCRLAKCHYTVCMCWSRNEYVHCSKARPIKHTEDYKPCSNKPPTVLKLLIGWCDKCMSTIESHHANTENYDRNRPAIKFRDALSVRRFWGLLTANRDLAKVRDIFSRLHDPEVSFEWDTVTDYSHMTVQPGHITWEGKLVQDVYYAAKATAVLLGPDSYDPDVVSWSEITQRARVYTIVWANGYEHGERHAPRVPLYLDKPYDEEFWTLAAPEMTRPPMDFQWWRRNTTSDLEGSEAPPPSYGQLFPASGGGLGH